MDCDVFLDHMQYFARDRAAHTLRCVPRSEKLRVSSDSSAFAKRVDIDCTVRRVIDRVRANNRARPACHTHLPSLIELQ